MARVTNSSRSPRGIRTSTGLRWLKPGSSIEAEFDGEYLARLANRKGFEVKGQPSTEPGPLDQSVEKLAAYLETVTDADEVQKLIDAETAGKSRAGAIAALEARRDALLA